MTQLQTKYTNLKKAARQAVSEMKRDIVLTGNGKLRASTTRELKNSESLLIFQQRMGPTATGFKSKHCECTRASFFTY